MGIEHKVAKTEINERKYELIKFGAVKSVKLAAKLGKTLIPMIGDSEAAMQLLTKMDDDYYLEIIQELLSSLTFEGKTISFDDHFCRYQEDLLPVVAFSLKENVMGFFSQSALESLANLLGNQD